MTTITADSADKTRALLRAAGDMYGSEQLARDLDIEPRSFYRWVDGSRAIPARVPEQVRQLLIKRRQAIVVVIQQLRIVEGLADENR